jgi:glycosyltransferase involved in cell wall biosynthesis
MWAAARTLAPYADVSVVTSSRWRDRHDELARSNDDRLPAGVRFAFADEPTGDLSPFASWPQLWSLRLLAAAASLHPEGGPDVLEVADYHAEGFAAAHARRGRDPRLRRTALAVRLHTSGEICAALNEEPQTFHLRMLFGVERFGLKFADALLWPGGNSLERYTEFYGEDALAPAIRCPLPQADDLLTPASADPPAIDGPLRLLYLNRLERRKGIAELVRAVRSLPDADLALTVVGRDTMSGPDQGSMRAYVDELVADDPRVELVDEVPHQDVPRLIADHHAVVVPTRWETFSYVVREALACNRPVLATPAGSIVDVVRPGLSGWLARSSSPEDLAAALREMIGARDTLARMIADRKPRSIFEEDTGEEQLLGAYRELIERSERQASTGPNGAPTQVDAIVACASGGGDPLPTLRSLGSQRGVSLTPVLAVDASGDFPGPGAAPAHARAVLAPSDAPTGRPAAWAAGLAATSAELVLLLPGGALLEPSFVKRAVATLAAEPRIAYVTSFATEGARPWCAPPGNYALPIEELDAGPSVVLARRASLIDVLGDPGSAPPDERRLFARLAEAGAYGVVLQEPLLANLPRRAEQLPVTNGSAVPG